MLSVLFGVSGAIFFGAADYLGGIAAKFMGSLRTSWIAATLGLLTMIVGFALTGGAWSVEAIYWGALSGVSGMLAIIFLYASLAIGPMSILSPIGALVAAVVPVIWDFAVGNTLSPLAYIALAVALVAVWMIGFAPDQNAVRPSARGLTFAVLAGMLIGIFMILINEAPDEAGILPLIANRITQTVSLGIAVAAASLVHWMHKRGKWGHLGKPRADVAVGDTGALNWRKGLPSAMVGGVIDAIGNIMILFGFLSGSLSVVSVLAGLYPASTILLAALILKERIATLQYIGLGLAIAAAATLAVA